MSKLDDQIARSFYAGRVSVVGMKPTDGEVELWRMNGTLIPHSGEFPAYSNGNGAISIPVGEALFGLRPGEFIWLEQSEFIKASSSWAPVDGEPAWIDPRREPGFSKR